jgi:hypothetical protein
MEQNFTQNDIISITNRGNTVATLEKQLQYFKNGITKINLLEYASVPNGIWAFETEEKQSLIAYFDKHKNNYDIVKFVPASGAASRMFKFLEEFLNQYNPETETINAYINRKNATDLAVFLAGLKSFPFYDIVKRKTLEKYPNYREFERDQKDYAFIKTMLEKDGFHFSNKPKGILPFHKHETEVLTPIEEHLKEAEYYKNPSKKTKLHFTVSKEHQEDFEKITTPFLNQFDITFSYQMASTDTIAVNPDNTVFRLENNELFFRPGGHGALIENLNQLDSDIIFIKNIDNVSHNHLAAIIENKKMLGGVMLRLQFQIFNYLNKLASKNLTEADIHEIVNFTQKKLLIDLSDEFDNFTFDYKISYLFEKMNKPIRVCGMVKNEGEPGGGPFWVKSPKGTISLQIVETSQVDTANANQLEILNEATHFNPVDIVCGIKNYKNEKFDLKNYIDENAGFIVSKTKNGKPIKAYELPGLWNGAMANWLTVFVEVPLLTFNPVKTVNDLLKPSHQPNNE